MEPSTVAHTPRSSSNSMQSSTSLGNDVHPALERSEILQYLFKLLRYKVLIQLRGVSKIWNEEVCLILRDISYVHLGGKSDDSLKEIQEIIEKSRQLNITSPFKSFFIYFREKPNEPITKILQNSEFVVTGFNYHRDGSIYAKSNDFEAKQVLRNFLNKYGSGMKHIIYVYDLNEEVETPEVEPEDEQMAIEMFAISQGRLLNQTQNQVQNQAQNQNQVQNQAQNQNQVQNQAQNQNQVQNQVQNQAQNQNQVQNQAQTQNQHQNEAHNQDQNQFQSQEQNLEQNQVQNQIQNQDQNEEQNLEQNQVQNQNQNQNQDQNQDQNLEQNQVQNQNQDQNQDQNLEQNQVQNQIQDQNQNQDQGQNQEQNQDHNQVNITGATLETEVETTAISTVEDQILTEHLQADIEIERSKEPIPFRLPSLTTFEYWEREITSTCESLDLICEMLSNGPKIKKFVTNTRYPEIFVGLINRNLLDSLNDLHIIDCKTGSYNSLIASTARFPELRSLALQYWQDTSQQMSLRRLNNLINKIKNSIKEISLSCVDLTSPPAAIVRIQEFPRCPQLQTLLLHDWRGSLNSFTQEKLPNLKELYVSNFAMDIESQDDFRIRPHWKVNHFAVRGSFSMGGAGVRMRRSNVEVFVSLLDFARLQYPNLTSLNLTMETMPSKLVMSIIRIFPHLETLELQLYTDDALRVETFESIEDFFTGINPHTLERAMSSFEFSDLRRSPCIIDMKRLKKLILKQNGLGILITDNSIKYGLSKIDSLKSFAFDMNPVITNDVICEFLNHVPEIIILVDSKRMEEIFDEDTVEIFDDVVTDLDKRLPQLIIDKSGTDPVEKFDFRNY